MRRRTRRGAGERRGIFFTRQGKRGGFFRRASPHGRGRPARRLSALRGGGRPASGTRSEAARGKNAEKGEALCPAQPLSFFSLYALYATGVPSAAERQRGASRRRGRNAGAPCAERINFAATARGVCAVLPEFHTAAAGKSGKSVRRTAVFFTKGKTAERPAGRGGRGFRRERPGRRSLQCFYKVDGKNTFSRV